MQPNTLLQKFQDVNSYTEPNNVVVRGIIASDYSLNNIIKELMEMLKDNFPKTKSILGEELTSIVIMKGYDSYKYDNAILCFDNNSFSLTD